VFGCGVTEICRSDGSEHPASQIGALSSINEIFLDDENEIGRKTRLFPLREVQLP